MDTELLRGLILGRLARWRHAGLSARALEVAMLNEAALWLREQYPASVVLTFWSKLTGSRPETAAAWRRAAARLHAAAFDVAALATDLAPWVPLRWPA